MYFLSTLSGLIADVNSALRGSRKIPDEKGKIGQIWFFLLLFSEMARLRYFGLLIALTDDKFK
jgi:hypothetical protein